MVSLAYTPAGYYDASEDFRVDAATATSGNGVWQYGSLSGLSSPATSFGLYSLTTLTFDAVAGYEGYYTAPVGSGSPPPLPLLLSNQTSPPSTIVDGTASVPVGFLNLHPGTSGQYSALRFVSPVTATYDVAGQFQGQDSAGTTADVHILQVTQSTGTSASLFSASVDGYYGGGGGGSPSGTSPIVAFSLSRVSLAPGDSLLFLVGDGDDGSGFYSDNIGLAVRVAPSLSSAHPALAPDDPFGYLGGLGYWQGDTGAAETGTEATGAAGSAETGLTYVRQRWLDNSTGQWMSVDPVPTEPRYGYVRNSPTMRVDPSGTLSVPVSLLIRRKCAKLGYGSFTGLA